jgi:hypothetical protein
MAYMLHWGGTAYIACNDVFGQEDNYAGDLEDQTGINGNISCDPMFVIRLLATLILVIII